MGPSTKFANRPLPILSQPSKASSWALLIDSLPILTRALAQYILAIFEGGIMQARAHRDIGLFDRNVLVLRKHLDLLIRQEERVSA